MLVALKWTKPCFLHDCHRLHRLRRHLMSTSNTNEAMRRIRNIGIIAHIDAGKTTTTERMLYYAGLTRRIGEVDRGDTVMDYLPEERERGITITAAAITFPWRTHQINLIDTPGHVDFGMEVERSLRVLDGAVTIIDGSAGVQAQTRTVWKQAARHGVPRIVYINKMDKVGADFDRSLSDLKSKFSDLKFVPVSLPLLDADKRIMGVVDLLGNKTVEWKDDRGLVMETRPWEASDKDRWKSQREAAIEELASLDETLLNEYLEHGMDGLNEQSLRSSIRKLVIAKQIAPVLSGSSFSNIGVQSLMDAVIHYLPSPLDASQSISVIRTSDASQKPWSLVGEERLLALAFKVIHDEQRGLLVFLRIYTGSMTSKTTLRNTTQKIKERPLRLMKIFANKFEDCEMATSGSVVVLTGLKGTKTGDTLMAENETRSSGSEFRLSGIDAPEPVFTCSVEAETSAEEAAVDEALRLVSLEDPSIRVTRDEESGQRHLAGMGELHLEIVGNRITRDLRAKANFGKITISYREALDLGGQTVVIDESIDCTLHGLQLSGGLKLAIKSEESPSSSIVDFDVKMKDDVKVAIEEGLLSAIQNGPLASLPISGLSICVQGIMLSSDALATTMRHVAHFILKNWLSKQTSRLIEPIMAVEITIPQSHLGFVLTDIHSNRRGTVLETTVSSEHSEEVFVLAEIPLAEMLGYASQLRSRTAGHGSFSMQPLSYRPMSQSEQQKILESFGILPSSASLINSY